MLMWSAHWHPSHLNYFSIDQILKLGWIWPTSLFFCCSNPKFKLIWLRANVSIGEKEDYLGSFEAYCAPPKAFYICMRQTTMAEYDCGYICRNSVGDGVAFESYTLAGDKQIYARWNSRRPSLMIRFEDIRCQRYSPSTREIRSHRPPAENKHFLDGKHMLYSESNREVKWGQN